jgi:hypothetical protein
MNANTLSSAINFKNFTGATDSNLSDQFLNFLIQSASDDIEKYTGRKLRARQLTEYQRGQYTKRIYTHQYPIIEVTSVHDDTDREFEAGSLIDVDDYFVNAENGMIELVNGYFQKGVGNIKIIYTAGFDEFEVIENGNDKLDFNINEAVQAITIPAGTYTAEQLRKEIEDLMQAVDLNFNIKYNQFSGIFKISNTISFSILWNSGVNSFNNCANLLGFDASADDTEAASYESDYSVFGIPVDLEIACIKLAYQRFMETPQGQNRFGIESKGIQMETGGSTTKFRTEELPQEVQRILEAYRRKDWIY